MSGVPLVLPRIAGQDQRHANKRAPGRALSGQLVLGG